MIIRPLGDRVYLQLDAVEEKKLGSIWTPAMHHEPVRAATVLDVGPECTLFKKGDRVLVSYMAGLVIDTKIDGFTTVADTLRIVTEGEIPCRIEE